MKTVILWGAGQYCERLLKKYRVPLKLIEGIVDSNEKRRGTTFFGKEIMSPEALYQFKSNLVLIATEQYYEEVLEQFLSMHTGKESGQLQDFLINQAFAEGEESTADWHSNVEKKFLMSRLENAGRLRKEHLEGAQVISSRYDVLDLLPKGMIVAEVGVAYGDFSNAILKRMKPEHFYAIDFLNKNDPYISFWGRNDFLECNLTHEEWYRNRFADLIAENKMTVCSGFSWDCLETFEDNFFDYLYIDACHDYESVKRDIEVAIKKVKHGGYIQFNDYTLYDIYTQTYYGVIPAVNELINKTNSRVLYYCLDMQRFDDIVVQINKK